MTDSNDIQQQIERYKRLVQRYEELDRQIDALLTRNHGRTENMSPDDLQHYRELARQRDDVFSEMRSLQEILFVDDDNNT